MEYSQYISIDLKSFFASVECVDRGLDPMKTNLVVADKTRTEKTICLAVSPSLKAYGISGRARLFEVIQKVRAVNEIRKREAPERNFTRKSYLDEEIKSDPSVALDYIVAPPHMARYIEMSTKIYNIYTQFVAPEDIHVYSIDEVFMDVSKYLKTYGLTARELASKMIRSVLDKTGITATAGIGTNLYLCKVAMDIGAKRVAPDQNGVRIAEFNEESYRRTLWAYRPLTDFWRVGKGYAEKLEAYGLNTMGDIARCSIDNEEFLYRMFGINAELLIDHAWGYEPCTISDVKSYRPKESSIGAGQVLQSAYTFEKGGLIVREMADSLALDLVDKDLVTNQLVLTVGYDTENLSDPETAINYKGEIKTDRYGRKIPKHAHGTFNLNHYTSSTKIITNAIAELYERIVDKALLVRRMYVVANHVKARNAVSKKNVQLNLFDDVLISEQTAAAEEELQRERNVQEAVLSIHKKFGKNALVKGMNLEEGATSIERNGLIGGHKK